MRPMDVLCVCLLACVLPVRPAPPPTVKTGIKEKFKEFLRKAVYGITPTTIYTTLRPNKFPEEYDPIKLLDWQLREEKRKGITTPDYAPTLTDVTNLWDGYFNDPTFDDITLWCMRHLHANDSRPTTVKRYWEPEFGNGESIEAIARFWKEEALRENAEWAATFQTTKYVPLEDLTANSAGDFRLSPNWESNNLDSEEKHLMSEAQRKMDDRFERELAKYNFNYSPRTLEETPAPTPEETLPGGATIPRTRTPLMPGCMLRSESVEEVMDAEPRRPRP